MDIILSTSSPASEVWGKNAILSFNDNKAIIHLKNNPKNDCTLVQRAGRKLRAQGIKEAKLVGEEWDLAFCWAFYQGF